MLFLDNASANVFCLPSIWLAVSQKLWYDARKTSKHTKCMRWLSLQEVLLSTSTTALLSTLKVMIFPLHWEPYSAAATTTGTSSFTAMEQVCNCTDQGKLNHFCCQSAPHPHEPDASEYTVMSDEYFWVSHSIEMPFQFSTNKCHHKMSARAALLSLMWCIGWEPTSWRAYSLLRNGLPGRTTLVANWSRPVMDWSAFFEITLFDTTCESSFLRFVSLSSGKRICKAMVSTSIPRKVRHVTGPTNLEGLRGTPKTLQVETSDCFCSSTSDNDLATRISHLNSVVPLGVSGLKSTVVHLLPLRK